MASDDILTSNSPPSLLHLTTQIVATNIEKYPAGLWGLLSESQWDQIIRARVAQKRPKRATANTNTTTQQLDSNSGNKYNASPRTGTSGLLPPLSAKHLSIIEQHPNNTHLATSTVADALVWQHILNYKFRENMMNRPTSLSVPLNYVEKRLRECADNLVRCVESKSISFHDFSMQCKQEDEQQRNNEQRRRLSDVLFNDSEDQSDNDDQEDNSLNEQLIQRQYKLHMKQTAHQNFETLKRTCITLSESPMNIQLLAETKIGKSVSKAVKNLTKMKRTCEKNDRGVDIEIREIFWKRIVKWNYGGGSDNSSKMQRDRVVELTLLDFLKKLLDNWKEMASDNGVGMSSDSAAASPPAAASPAKKRQRVEMNQNKNESSKTSSVKDDDNDIIICVTSCGRDKHISYNQHQIDMKLLHQSPDWRSLYASLINRELDLRKSHGEKVRATREHLERDRPKIGKVVLKRAVGRVKGGDVGLRGGSVGLMMQRNVGENGSASPMSKAPIQMTVGDTTTNQSNFATTSKAARHEAILNKSKGLRTLQKQRSLGGGASTSSTKVSQIRQTSKVAAKWGKSSFGSSVASAAGAKNGVRKVGMRRNQAQVQVSLQNGKTMMLPSSSNTAGKAAGKYSSLQMKMAAKSRGGKKR